MTVSQEVQSPVAADRRRRRTRLVALGAAVVLVVAGVVTAVLALNGGGGAKAPTITMPASIGGVARTTPTDQLSTNQDARKWTARFDAPAQYAGYMLANGFPMYGLLAVSAPLSKLYPDLRTALGKWLNDQPDDFSADLRHASYRTVDGVKYAEFVGYVDANPVVTVTMWDGKGSFGYLVHFLISTTIPPAADEVARTHDVLDTTIR